MHIKRYARLLLASAALASCFTQGTSVAADASEYRQKLLAKKAEILAEAEKDPYNALFTREVYVVGTPKEIQKLIGKQKLGMRVITSTTKIPRGHGPVSQLPFPRMKQTSRRYESPLAVASWETPYPEVIHMLVKAGCKATDVTSEPLYGALYNANPKVLAAVLKYKPNLDGEKGSRARALFSLCTSRPDEFKREHMRLLLAAGANPNLAEEEGGDTPLMRAAMFGLKDAVKMLLAAKADPAYANRRGEHALDKAIGKRSYDTAMEILLAGAPVRYPPTRLGGRESENESALERLAGEKNADPNLGRAIIKKLGGLECPEAEKALVIAGKSGSSALLKVLLERAYSKETVNAALGACILNGHRSNAESAALLLAAGGDPNLLVKETPLIGWAAYYGLPEQTAMLLNAGANVNVCDHEGRNPMYLLVDGGRHSNWTENAGRDRQERDETLTLLLGAGANFIQKAKNGKTALEFAKESKNTAAILERLAAAKK